MPTIALLNGHAFAGGIMLSMYHDYRIFNPTRGFLCLNELDLGVPLKPAMSSIFRQKLTPQVYTEMVLEAKRYSGKEALEKGIVDGLGGWEEVVRMVDERKLTAKVEKGVYGLLKREMWRETLGYIDTLDGEEVKFQEAEEKDDKRKEEGINRVKEWERKSTKARL
jgi:Delta3-Delta2-enoyl-CoA isomerase